MARTIEEIKREITTAFMADEDIRSKYGFRGNVFENEFSKVSLESLIFYEVAVSIWSLEKLMDVFEQEQITAFKNMHPHTLYWYTDKAKAYQHGYHLPPYEDVYDNANISEEDINSSKIVTYASCTNSSRGAGINYLNLKVAKGVGDDMSALDKDLELVPFTAYMEQIKDAGVDLECNSYDADKMKLTVTVQVDAKLFYDTGELIADGSFPIETAFKDYLKNLAFDGIYQKTAHIDYVQKVQGVKAVDITFCEVTYGNGVPSEEVFDGFRPFSGWIRFYDEQDLNITYKTRY
jgi:hypothetical protein